MTKELTEHIEPFHALGVDLVHSSGREWTASCPLCGKDEGHWSVNDTNGLWECKSCGESGNQYTFMNIYYQDALSKTTVKDYKELASLREPLTYQELRRQKLAYDEFTDQWIIPVYNLKGKLSMLRTWGEHRIKKNGKFVTQTQLRNLKGCNARLFLGNEIEHQLVLLCEGEWDAMALNQVVRKANIEASVVAAPGANVYKATWNPAFAGKDVWIIYDKDPDRKTESGKITNPGKDGMARVLRQFQAARKKPASVKIVDWPDSLPEKYDIRDFCNDHVGKSKTAWKNLTKMMVEPDDIDIKGTPAPAITRATFAEVVEDFRANAKTNKVLEDTLAVCLATALSVRIPGDPIWLFLVGPPGAGKSLILDSFNTARDYAVCMSKMTDTSLVSGWKADGEDVSMIPRLNEKCLVIKDYTTIISLPAGTQEKLYGVLRDVYDGEFITKYGNTSEMTEYNNINFSFIAGVTDAIHRNDRAELGERFLKVELLERDYDPRELIHAAMTGTNLKHERAKVLRDSVHAYLTNPIDTSSLPEIPAWMGAKLVSLSQLLANIRTNVARSGADRSLMYRPRPEVGSRPAAQLMRLAQCLCYVLGKDKADDEIYRLCHKVAMDTCIGLQQEVAEYLYKRTKSKKGITAGYIATKIRLSDSHTKRILEDMMEIGIVENDWVSNGSGNRGRQSKVWRLTPELAELWAHSIPREVTDGDTPTTRGKRNSSNTRRKASTRTTRKRKRRRANN